MNFRSSLHQLFLKSSVNYFGSGKSFLVEILAWITCSFFLNGPLQDFDDIHPQPFWLFSVLFFEKYLKVALCTLSFLIQNGFTDLLIYGSILIVLFVIMVSKVTCSESCSGYQVFPFPSIYRIHFPALLR